MKKLNWGFSLFLMVGMLGIGQSLMAGLPPLTTVANFDLNRYLGKWYEIGSIRQSFTRGCDGTTATYTLRPDGNIDVFNQCRGDWPTGNIRGIHGKARVPNRAEPAKLEVQFFWPFSGAYWVIELGQNYEYAVVGHPNREYLWILSRQPYMDEVLYRDILGRLEAKGYDISLIEKTLQGGQD